MADSKTFNRDKIRRLRERGLSLRSVAREVGCSASLVRAVCMPASAPRYGRPAKIDGEELRKMRAEEMTIDEIAEATGASTAAVSRAIKRHGVRPKPRGMPPNSTINPDRIDAIKILVAAQWTNARIARAMRCTPQAIFEIRRRYQF